MEETQVRLSQLIDRLKERGHRMTPQRVAVLKILATSHDHLSVEQIHDRVVQEFPMTSLATIYKTVNLLKEMGELLELSLGSESNRYDGVRPYPHPHLVCIKCQAILDPEVDVLSELPRQVAAMYGYEIVGHRLDFFGVCPTCQENTQPFENQHHISNEGDK